MQHTDSSRNLQARIVKMLVAAQIAVFFCLDGYGQDTSKPFSPLTFGPNALQVPEMADGNLSGTLDFSLGGDFYYGFATATPDYTESISFVFRAPLFTPRANLVIWGQVGEFYQGNPQTQAFRHVSPDKPLNGALFTGTMYVSTDFLLLKERKYSPSITVRATMKTASEPFGNELGRFYDVPGYFFDVAFGKSFGPFRIAASAGFLCWQTSAIVQNDAFMYGVRASYNKKAIKASLEYGGYIGWQQNGDKPMTLKARFSYNLGKFEPFAIAAYGFKDWPFAQISAGVQYHWDVMKATRTDQTPD